MPEFNIEKHSIVDWVRMSGGIAISSVTRDAGEIRHVCSRKEIGYNLLNKYGKTLDELTESARDEGWLPEYASHDDFLKIIGDDIQAKKNGNMMGRAWHPTRDWDDLLDDAMSKYDFPVECVSCGNPVASYLLLSADGISEWYEVNCDACVDMLEGLV